MPDAKLSNTNLIENSKAELKRWLQSGNKRVSANKTTLHEGSVSYFNSPFNVN